MPAEKSLAIVLRVVDFSETSCVVTLFTEHCGRITALAKGARRPKGPFEGALDLLASCNVVFLRKSADALDLLTEAKLERRFRAASRSLARLYAGLYLAELLLAWTESADPHPQLFQLADQCLRQLDDEGPVPQMVIHFEVRGLQLLGLFPSLHGCVGCGVAVDPDRRAAFGLIAGGVLCPECKRGKRQVISLSSAARATMCRLAEQQAVDWAHENLLAGVWGEVRGVLNNLITHQLERKPRLLPFMTRYRQDD